MKYEKFKIANMVKDLIVNLDTNLTNFPKKEVELKKSIMQTAYNLLLTVYEGNTAEDIQRRNIIQEKAIASIKYLDFLINLCYDKQIINGKKYIKFGEKLDQIIRYIVAWKNASKEQTQGIIV